MLERDLRNAWQNDDTDLPYLRWRMSGRANPCIAAWLTPSDWATCSGRWTLDHVKDEPMMARKAPDDERHLVTLCARHHLELNWGERNRDIERDYLRRCYPPVI